MLIFRPMVVVFCTLLLILLSNVGLSCLRLKEKSSSKTLVDCLKSAGFNLEDLTMLFDECGETYLADEVMKTLEMPLTALTFGPQVPRGSFLIVFSYNRDLYKNLLEKTTSEDDKMEVIILLRWPNKVHTGETFESIFSLVWSHRTYNTFVLVEQENSNFKVYSYFPYSQHHCGKSGPPTLVDEWDSKKKQLTTNRFQLGTFSTRRIPLTKNFYGCLYKSIAINHPPESTTSPAENGTLTFQGVAGSLLVSAMRLYNFTLSITLVEDSLEGFYRDEQGYVRMQKSLKPVTQTLLSKQFDIAFGLFPYAMSFTPEIEYSLSYINKKLGFVVPCGTEGKYSMWKNYYLELSVPTWVCIAFMFFLISFSLKLMARCLLAKSTDFSSVGRNIFILFGVHLENITTPRPKPNTMRIFLSLVMFYCMVLSVGYKASLKSFLMAPLGAKTIETWEELEASTLKIRGGLFAHSVLKHNSEVQPFFKKLLKRFELNESAHFSDVLEMAVMKRDTAFLSPETFTDNLITSMGTDENRRGIQVICKVPKSVISSPVTPFLTKKGSPLVKILNHAIMYHLQGGLMEVFASPDVRGYISATGVNNEQEPFKLEHMKGAFFLWLFGTIFSTLTFAFEILYSKFYINRAIVL